MPKELVILLLFLLVAYVVVTSGLNYETFGEPRPNEYFTPEVTESND
jgi:cytochrome b559 alpha subunit